MTEIVACSDCGTTIPADRERCIHCSRRAQDDAVAGRVLARHRAGWSPSTIAVALGLTKTAVLAILERCSPRASEVR